MNKEACIAGIKKEKIIAIIRGCSAEKCLKTAQVLCEEGIRFVEITFDHTGTVPFRETLTAISKIRDKMDDQIQVGAGTVLDSAQVEKACEAGATYIISPDVNESVIYRTKEKGMVSIPGALSATEVSLAHRLGADFVKIFPANVLGPSYIKALNGPLGHIPMLAVGGISHDNLRDYLAAGYCGAGIGGKLADKRAIEKGEYNMIREIAAKTVAAAKR